MVINRIERGRYLDSVTLMRVSRKLEALDGVESVALMIGSPSNRALLSGAGLLAKEGQAATPNDLIIALKARDERSAQRALSEAQALLTEKQPAKPGASAHARSLSGALELLPQANLALISVPGEFAAYEARKALERGLHVFLFSDNVSLEEEAALKRLAAARQLLLMGPDCGTAIIAGTPLGFANAVPRGDIGLVSASGTGLQEVSTLIARLGGGVSHGIGVGGRDLDSRIGALSTLAAIEALDQDPATAKIVLISKPPAPDVAQRVIDRVRKSAKPCVVCFLGMENPGHGAAFAATLTEAAERAAGRRIEPLQRPQMAALKGRTVHGLYCGGTLRAEAELIFRRKGLSGHRFVDLGDDEYTRGRPHPMIEPDIRNDHVARALGDPAVGAVLVDVVLGYGAHENPAGVLLKVVDGKKPVIASVTGTEQDPQVWSRQVRMLREAGVIVAATNAQAAELAASLVP